MIILHNKLPPAFFNEKKRKEGIHLNRKKRNVDFTLLLRTCT